MNDRCELRVYSCVIGYLIAFSKARLRYEREKPQSQSLLRIEGWMVYFYHYQSSRPPACVVPLQNRSYLGQTCMQIPNHWRNSYSMKEQNWKLNQKQDHLSKLIFSIHSSIRCIAAANYYGRLPLYVLASVFISQETCYAYKLKFIVLSVVGSHALKTRNRVYTCMRSYFYGFDYTKQTMTLIA